jgi:predicted transcriptional regulator of viral defense system
MKYLDFKNRIKDLPVFSVTQLTLMAQDKQVFRNQISKWKKQGLIVPLKKGLYVLNEHDRKINPSREYIANQLVFPSYISLEYALSFYGIIPEKVYQVTSVTSKKTTEFENSFGTFTYRNLRTELFFGFVALKDENDLPILMADKEKALLDFLYLNLSHVNVHDRDFLEESYRMANLEEFDKALIRNYADCFHSKKLSQIIQNQFNER